RFGAGGGPKEGENGEGVAAGTAGAIVRDGTGTARAAARGFGGKGAPRHGEEVRGGTGISDGMCAAARQRGSRRSSRGDSAARVQLRSCMRQLTGPLPRQFPCGGAYFRGVAVRRRTFPGAGRGAGVRELPCGGAHSWRPVGRGGNDSSG